MSPSREIADRRPGGYDTPAWRLRRVFSRRARAAESTRGRGEGANPGRASRFFVDVANDSAICHVYCGSAKTYTALLPLVVSASGVMLTATAAIGPPPAVMAMYWRPLTE